MFVRKYICIYLTIFISNFNINQCIYRSQIVLSNNGYQFEPINYQAQILSRFIFPNNILRLCSISCNQNILCRIFDINGIVLNQCRLFQGDIYIHGNLTLSLNDNAKVGYIKYSTNLYSNYGQICSINSPENRYLICGNNLIWTCPSYTYWDSSTAKCLSQSPVLGSVCQQNLSMCRKDLNYTCLQFNQCGPLSILIGTTILDGSTVITNSSTVGLQYPYTIIVNQTMDNSIIVTNSAYQQVIRFYDFINTINNVSLVVQTWTGGYFLNMPFSISVSSSEKTSLYVSDYNNHCVFKIYNMQVISSVPTVVAGILGNSGSTTSQLNYPAGIVVDSYGNIFIADSINHRIIRWAPNSTNGSVVAGLGVPGSDSFSLNVPLGLAIDENNSYIYVCDSANHRIQKFSLFGGFPNHGTTIAGGNGQGSTNQQLNTPFVIYLSKKKNVFYIADSLNHRIQRWTQGEQSGVTMYGDPNGNPGSNAILLNWPYGLALDDQETFLYVVDTGNHRIQRFNLI